MYQVVTVPVTQKNMPALHAFLCEMCSLAKKLHHVALFRLRNHFTASHKETLTENERQVEDEVAMMAGAGIKPPKAVISYTKLEKLMHVTGNPDFLAGLPMQSAQWALKKAAGDMSIRSLKSCNAGTPGFTGKPRMPKYKKGGLFDIAAGALYNQENTGSNIGPVFKKKLPYERKLNMTKAELIDAVAEASGLSKVNSKEAVDAVVEVIKEEMLKGGKVTILGFGNFEVTERAGRMGRNPSTGEAVEISSSKNVKFKAGRAFKNALNA